jgi:hypothetical protein
MLEISNQRKQDEAGIRCWLGGSPCSGKSSISQMLSSRYDLHLYSVDEAFSRHSQSLDPTRQPALYHWAELSWNERWMRPVDILVQEAIDCYHEHFALVLADLLALPGNLPVLVEGSALLPERVACWAPEPQRALWVVPTAEFQRAHYSRRGWVQAILDECVDPEVAFCNWMNRDARFADWVSGEAQRLGYRVLVVDGRQSLVENARQVGIHFGLSPGTARTER